MTQRITGMIAEIMDRYTVVINKGSDDGVAVGMVFSVMGLGGDVIDPESKKSLGPRPVEKLRVKVSDVYPKFCVAETYRIVTPQSFADIFNRLGAGPGPLHDPMIGMRIGAPRGPEREQIAGQPSPEDATPTDPVASVAVGDTVRQLVR